MKIIYIHQYFRTPEEGGPMRSYYLAKGLVDNGNEVEMITAYNGKRYLYKNIEGINVHYLPVFYENKLNYFRRILAFIRFLFKAYKTAKNIRDADTCYATSTPLTVGIIALMLKRYQKLPYYFEVRDLWPEAPIQMNVISNPLFKKILYKLERVIYQNAEKIITLSPGIREGVEQTAPGKTTSLIPNISDCGFFKREMKNSALENKFNVQDKFVVTYFGAIGKVNRLDYLLDVASYARKTFPNMHFFIAGDGSELSRIRKDAGKRRLDNITFTGYLDKKALSDLLNVTDATFISFEKKKIFETNSPNKFFDSLAAGKLCIVNMGGWIKELVEKNRCGFYVNPDKPQEFIDKILPFLEDKTLINEFQYNARVLAETFFSRELLTQKLIRVINKEEQLKPIEPSVYILTA